MTAAKELKLSDQDSLVAAAVARLDSVDRAAITAALRMQVLRLSSEALSKHGDAALCGVVIDTAYADRVVSLAAMRDGSASWYVSNGLGCVGCGEHDGVRAAASALVRRAESASDAAAPTDDYARPAAGSVRFFFLTPVGLRLAEAPLDAVVRGDSLLAQLYGVGQRLLQLAERVGAGRSVQNEIERALAERPVATR